MNTFKKLYELRPTLDKARHIVKSISYRFYSTCITITIASVVTGSTKLAFAIGSADFFIKIFTYYIHERIWFYIPFGLQKPRKVHTEITWDLIKNELLHKQIMFIENEKDSIRKRVKITKNNKEQYRAIMSSYNRDTKERFNDFYEGTKEELENKLNIDIVDHGKQ